MVSEYERLRKEKIARNLQMMEEMGLKSSATAFKRRVAEAKTAPVKRAKTAPVPAGPRRTSARLQGKEAATFSDVKLSPTKSLRTHSDTDASDVTSLPTEALGGLVGDDDEAVVVPPLEDAKYTLDNLDVEKVTPSRIYAIACHPSTSTGKVLSAIADVDGNLTLWSVPVDRASQTENTIVSWRPHKQAISSVHFEAKSLLASCFDGSISQYDLESKKFTSVYTSDSAVLYVDPTEPNALLGCDETGHVFIVDRRAARQTASWELHEKKINTVHRQPGSPNTFATASLDRTVCIWDARKPATAIATLPHHRSINCAYFSPNGEALVTVGQDDFVHVYEMPATDRPTTRFAHNNQTGRWLTKFHAHWDPKCIDRPRYVLASTAQPRCVEIFGVDSKRPLQRLAHDELFRSIHSMNTFHPTIDVIVGGNSSGRAVVWRGTSAE
ncbi:WD repeat-containing protein 76-like [Achlya hypogyna]|uniref:WD repeat-containing protein 76-like n=1 Tax=Achlya hypogyna TaxID=1202772 RepID=A0A1V9YZQ7_ACHHY|nr:WD repeat-containing protein 76-like [Achlya hypogyna]